MKVQPLIATSTFATAFDSRVGSRSGSSPPARPSLVNAPEAIRQEWNSHDLDRIMGHYSERIEFVSPFIVKLLGDPPGIVRGKEALRDYFSKGLANIPTSHSIFTKSFLACEVSRSIMKASRSDGCRDDGAR